jgi:hypothetical protein
MPGKNILLVFRKEWEFESQLTVCEITILNKNIIRYYTKELLLHYDLQVFFFNNYCSFLFFLLQITYLAAFSCEISWILEARGNLPIAAYLLCAGYFILFVASTILIHGLVTVSVLKLIFYHISSVFSYCSCCLISGSIMGTF